MCNSVGMERGRNGEIFGKEIEIEIERDEEEREREMRERGSEFTYSRRLSVVVVQKQQHFTVNVRT